MKRNDPASNKVAVMKRFLESRARNAGAGEKTGLRKLNTVKDGLSKDVFREYHLGRGGGRG